MLLSLYRERILRMLIKLIRLKKDFVMSNVTTISDLLEKMAHCFLVNDGELNVYASAVMKVRETLIEKTKGLNLHLDPQNCFPPLLPGADYQVHSHTPADFSDHIIVSTEKETGEFVLSIPQFINAFHDAKLNSAE